jgi:hypothetical protein
MIKTSPEMASGLVAFSKMIFNGSVDHAAARLSAAAFGGPAQAGMVFVPIA